jgi:hypothetical protein
MHPTKIKFTGQKHYSWSQLASWKAFLLLPIVKDQFYVLVIRVPGYKSRGPVSIPGATRFSE